MNSPNLTLDVYILYFEYTRSLFMVFQRKILYPYFFKYRNRMFRMHGILSSRKMGCEEETTTMAHILDLNEDLLNLILTFLVVFDSGATDWARASATCKKFRTVAIETNVLRAINCRNVKQVSHCESLHHINGLLSRCVRAENSSADYFLAKAILAGGNQLWKMIIENDLTNSSIKCATALPLSERRSIAKSLTTGSIADLPYILFSLEEKPDLHESYARLRHMRLMRSFILHVDLEEFFPLFHIFKDFMEFFVGYHKYSESDIHDTSLRMFLYESITRRDIQLPNDALETLGLLRLPSGSLSYRNQVILALDNLLQQEPLSY